MHSVGGIHRPNCEGDLKSIIIYQLLCPLCLCQGQRSPSLCWPRLWPKWCRSPLGRSELFWDDDERTCLMGLHIVISAPRRVFHHTSLLPFREWHWSAVRWQMADTEFLERRFIGCGVFWSIVYSYRCLSFQLHVSHFILEGKCTVA